MKAMSDNFDLKGMVHTPELAPAVTKFTQDGSGFWNLLGYEPCHIIQYLANEDTAVLHCQKEPKVGIFCYNEKTDELFGVSKQNRGKRASI